MFRLYSILALDIFTNWVSTKFSISVDTIYHMAQCKCSLDIHIFACIQFIQYLCSIMFDIVWGLKIVLKVTGHGFKEEDWKKVWTHDIAIYFSIPAFQQEYRGGRKSRGSKKGLDWWGKRIRERKVCRCLWELLW